MIFNTVLKHLESKNWNEAVISLKQINFKEIPVDHIIRELPNMEIATYNCKNQDFWDVWELVLLKFNQRYKAKLTGQVKVVTVKQLRGLKHLPCEINIKSINAEKVAELHKDLEIDIAAELQQQRFGDCDDPKIINIIGHATADGFIGENLSPSHLASIIAVQFPNAEIVNLYGNNIASNNQKQMLPNGELPYCLDLAVQLYHLGQRFVQINGATKMEFTGSDGCSYASSTLLPELSKSVVQHQQLAAMILKNVMVNWWTIQDPQQLLLEFDAWCNSQGLDLNPIINHLDFDQPAKLELRNLMLSMRTIRHEQNNLESIQDKIKRMAEVVANWIQEYIDSPSSKNLTLPNLLDAIPDTLLSQEIKVEHSQFTQTIQDWWKMQLRLVQAQIDSYDISVSYYEPASSASIYADEVFEFLHKTPIDNVEGHCKKIMESVEFSQWTKLYEEAKMFSLTPLLRLRPYNTLRVGDRDHEAKMKHKCLPTWL